MKTMKHSGKKVLSVFLAVLMVMTAWVFVAPTEAEAVSAVSISADNATALDSIGPFNTDVAFFYDHNWAYNGDNQDNEVNVYKNVLYASDCGSSATASTGSVNLKDSGAATIEWYHGTYIFLYDGVTTPTAGVMVAVKPKNSSHNVRMYSSYINQGEGLSLQHNWYAKDGRANFMWVISSPSDSTNAATNDGSINSTYCWTVNSNTWYANRLQFTGSMSDSEYYKDITVTWGWKGNQKSQGTGSVYTHGAQSVNHVYVVNYKPLKAALDEALGTGAYSIANLKNNTAKYTTASIAEYVAAVKDLIAAKPNNYVNSNNNNYMGYANAASAAVTRFNNAKANLEVQEYSVTFKDINGDEKDTQTYDYGTTVNLAELAASVSNTLKQGNEQGHQTYTWGNLSTSHIVTDDVTISESPKAIVAHTYSPWTQNENDHTRTCSVCGYVQTQEHIKGTGYETKAETCTENGIKTYDCSICGKTDIVTETIDNITGHDFRDIVIKEEGENGSHWKKCSRCDAYGWSGVENACENHNWDKDKDGTVDASDAIETKASTCKEAGYEKYKCTVCNATWTKTLDFAAHKTIATAAKDVTTVCGGDGNEAFWSCSVCNKVWKDAALTDELTDTTDADGDNIPDALEVKGPDHEFTGAYVNVSNGADGTHYRQCSRFTQCGKYGLMVDGKAVVGATEKHSFTSTTEDSTCTKAGKTTYTCSGCKHTYTETLELAAHTMETIAAVAATCTTGGNNKYYKCTACSQYFKDENGTIKTTVEAEKIAALQHKWTEHHDYDTLKTAANCMNPAVYNNHCDYCKVPLVGSEHSYGTVDKVNGHKFNGEIVDLNNGKHAYKCTVAGCTEYGNQTDCVYKVVDDVASTCHTFGYTTYECETCGHGYSTYKKEYDSTNHEGGIEVKDAIEATCNTNGYTGDTYCLGCNTKIATGTAIVADKTVHPHENMKDYEAKAPTCQTEGWKAYRYCDQCGTYGIAKETIAKKAHKFTTYNSNGDGTHTAICDTCDEAIAAKATDTKDCSGGTANCVDKKVCTVCKTAYGEVDSSKHKTSVFVAKVDSTCQKTGTEAYYKCTACNTNIDTPVVIAKKDHSYGKWTKIDGEDKHTRSCTTCDAAVAEVATETAPCSGGVANCVELATCVTCKGEYGSINPAVHKTEANHLVGKKDATCQAPGYTGDYLYDCCNALKEEGTATAQLAHTFSIEVEGSRVLATCIAKGEVTYKCSTCVESEGVTAATQKKELPIDAKNHASEETITVNAKAATCESDGHTGDVYYSCCYDSTKTEAENRKALKEKGTVIKANGQHVYGEAVPEYLIEAIKEVKDDEGNVIRKEFDLKDADALTYDEMIAARRDDDKWYHAQICTICDEVTYDACYTYAHTSNCVETDTCEECGGLCSLKSPLDHKGTLTYVEKVPATCSVDGVKAHYVCSVCGEKFSDALGKKPVSDDDLKIDSAGGSHDIDYESAKPIGDGKHEYGCTRCSAKIEEECDGGTDYCNAKAKCEICGQEYGEIDETNHASTEVTLVGRVEATCSEDGYEGDEYYECCYDENKTKEENQKALKKEGKVIPSKPELHVIAYKETDGDTHTAYCTACIDADNAYSVTVAHEWVAGETPELESCTDEVVITSTCVCGKTKTETIVGEHDFEITVETKAATCSEAGYKKTFKACKKCNYSEELPEEILEKLPHNIVTEEAVKPTCDGVGKHAYTYCKNPGCPYGYKKDLFIGSLAGYEAYKNNDGKTVDKLGHQDKDNNGSCDNCYNPLKENIDGTRCNCICHKQNVFMKFLYKILQFFWKLFKIEQTCGCGTKHW